MRRLVRGNVRGFTLIELLIAVSLLAIGLLSAAAMQGMSINANGIANSQTVATALAQRVMEELLSRRVSDPLLTAAAAGLPYDLDPDSADTFVSVPSGGTFSASLSIQPDTPTPKVTRIAVTITYQAKSGVQSTYTLVGYKRVTTVVV